MTSGTKNACHVCDVISDRKQSMKVCVRAFLDSEFTLLVKCDIQEFQNKTHILSRFSELKQLNVT